MSMATYPYVKAGADLSRLQGECISAGLPVTHINGGAIGSPDIYVVTSRDLTASEITTLDGVVAAHDGRPRQPRTFGDILTEYNALPGATRTKVYQDLTAPANNPKWQEDRTSDFAALEFLTAQPGGSSTSIDKAKSYLAVAYCQRYPTYLVNPPFAPEVNIPGDEPVP
jgi:hypothetical protein